MKSSQPRYVIWHLELSWSTGRSQILVDSWSGWPVRSVVHGNVQAPQYLRCGGNYYWSLYLHILPERHEKLSGVVLDKVHNDWHIVLQLRLCVSCNGHLWFQSVIMWGSFLSLKIVGSSYRHIWSSASIIILMFWRLDHHLMVAGCLVTEIRISLSRKSWNTRSFKIYGSYLFCMKYSVAQSLKP